MIDLREMFREIDAVIKKYTPHGHNLKELTDTERYELVDASERTASRVSSRAGD